MMLHYRTAAKLAALVSAAIAGSWPVAVADVVTLDALQDNTLYEDDAGALSNGAGEHMFTGVNAIGLTRRALVAFDLVGAVPAGSTIDSATLTLHMSMTIGEPQVVFVHRVLQDWGEGDSNATFMGGGSGAEAARGDATWLHSSFPDSFWATPGGDVHPDPSAAQLIGTAMQFGFYSWGSTPALVADVQGWADDSSQNFGWALIGNEAGAMTTKRFDTDENNGPSVRPRLTVQFTPPRSLRGDVNGDGVIDVSDLTGVILGWGRCLPDDPCPADLNGDGVVDVVDLTEVILNWTSA